MSCTPRRWRLHYLIKAAGLAPVRLHAKSHGTSWSAALHEAITMLRRQGLAEEYEAAADEWDSSGDAAAWDFTLADGLA